MSLSATSHRPSRARLAGALLAITLLAAGCGDGGQDAPDDAATQASDAGSEDSSGAGSDAGGASDGSSEATVDPSGASDGGGMTAAAVPKDPYAVTPAPDGFEPPEACSGEGAYFTTIGSPASPELPERDGETLAIEATGISGDDAQLSATLGSGEPRPIEDITLGETVDIEGWTLSVTSVCADTEQVEFDLIN